MMKLSTFFKDPAVRSAFERAERDNGSVVVSSAPKSPDLNSGSAKVLEAV